MISSKIRTIEEVLHKTDENRFTLCHLVMKRTNAMIKGARPLSGLSKEFTPRRVGEIPNNSFKNVAMEELRLGRMTWKRIDETTPEEAMTKLDNDLIFEGK